MSAQVVQVDLGALHGGSALVQAAWFYIEVFHQSHSAPEPLAGIAALKELGDACKRFEEAVLAFQQIAGAQQPHPHFLLELEFQGTAMLGEELGQLLMQLTNTFGLNDNLWVLQACQGSLDLQECNRLIPGSERL